MKIIDRILILLVTFSIMQGCDDSNEPIDQDEAGSLQGGEREGGGRDAGDSVAGSTGGGEIVGGEVEGGDTAGVEAGSIAGASGGSEGGEMGGSGGGGAGGEYEPLDPCRQVHATEALPSEARLSEERGEVSVSVEGEGCERRFFLETTAPLRDPNDARLRTLVETLDRPSLHTHNPLTDALYALAVTEAEECSVASISDGAFLGGMNLPCERGGCFETGALWTYVWTRDTAYSVDLGLALFDPQRAVNSLRFKLSARRGGGGSQIIQDTGSGGSYPISTDRSVWALGARAAIATLRGEERTRFEAEAYEAMQNTIEHDRVVVFDPQDGLYRGEQSFLDWREQSYPEWVAGDVVHLGMSKSLSTNVAHFALLELTAELAGRAGEAERQARYRAWAEGLKVAINERLWLEEVGLYSTFIPTQLDDHPAYRYDLLGNALAISTGVASPEQAKRIISTYPLLPHGPAVQWPQLRNIPIYHNRGIWPFVTAYALRAARIAQNPTVVNLHIESLLKGAGLNLSNMENLDAGTGLAYADDGWLSGPVVNSKRQLWSVAGALGLFHEQLFGLTPDLEGLRVQPWITEYARANLLGGSSQVVLAALPWSDGQLDVILRFEDASQEGETSIDRPLVWTPVSWSLDGQPMSEGIVPLELEGDRHQIVVQLALSDIQAGMGEYIRVNPSEIEAYYSPLTPRITRVSLDTGGVTLALDVPEGAANPNRLLNIYRDGALIAGGVSPSQSWLDEQAPSDQTLCYTAELVSVSSGNRSQRSQPTCLWTQIDTLYAGDFTASGGERVDQYGRIHFQGWGGPEDQLSIEWIAQRSGAALIQAEYGNGAGAINTGVTCAVKRVDLVSLPDEVSRGGGYLMMPHLGQWDRWSGSNFIPVEVTEGARYRITVSQDDYAINMSTFEHFASYTGGSGGVGGPFNDVNISELKVLYLE